jgi:hypothetical protein
MVEYTINTTSNLNSEEFINTIVSQDLKKLRTLIDERPLEVG